MIVCNCKAATDRDVHSAIQRGADSLGDLKRCGIGGDCGSCHDVLRTLLRRWDVGASACAAHPPNVPTSQPAVITSAP